MCGCNLWLVPKCTPRVIWLVLEGYMASPEKLSSSKQPSEATRLFLASCFPLGNSACAESIILIIVSIDKELLIFEEAVGRGNGEGEDAPAEGREGK